MRPRWPSCRSWCVRLSVCGRIAPRLIRNNESDKIYVDAFQPATLRHSGHSVDGPTRQEAVSCFRLAHTS